MYVRWKTLFGLGAILWMLLCITDFFTDKNGFQRNEDWLADLDLTKEEFYAKTAEHLNKLQIEEAEAETNFTFSWKLILWNFFAFFTSIICCRISRRAIIKGITYYMNRAKPLTSDVGTTLSVTSTEAKGSTSKIPIPVQSKSSEISLATRASREKGDDGSMFIEETPSSILANFEKRVENERLGQNLEKQCAKLKEEMLAIQENALRGQAVLNRKLETVTREKRELSKQLAIAHKENRGAKQQLEELLSERSMLLKRLENATREFRINTKTKKVTLARLEEAHSKIDSLKSQLDLVVKEKEALEEKSKLLMEEYDKMTIPVKDTSNINEDKAPTKSDSKEHVIDNKSEVTDNKSDTEAVITDNGDKNALQPPPPPPPTITITQTAEEDPTISQATIDMKKIQKKIEALEKNLQKFKPKITADQQEKQETPKQKIEQKLEYKEIFTRDKPKSSLICNKPNCPLEHEECSKLECLLSDIPNFNAIPKRTTKIEDYLPKCCESIEMLKPEKKKNGPDLRKNDSMCPSSEESGPNKSETGSSIIDYDSTSSANESKKGIVSRSPAFQRFLQKLDAPKKKKTVMKKGSSIPTMIPYVS